MVDTAEDTIQILGQMTSQGGGGGHIERFRWDVSRTRALWVQFQCQQAGVMAECVRRGGYLVHYRSRVVLCRASSRPAEADGKTRFVYHARLTGTASL